MNSWILVLLNWR